MFGLPAWLISALIKLATTFGVPFLMQKLAWVPKEVWSFIIEALKHIGEAQDKPAAIARVNKRLKECHGAFCESDLKRD